MIGCPDFETLSLAADDLASEAVAAHIAECAACASRVEAIRRLGDGLRALPAARHQAPPELGRRLEGRIDLGRPRTRRRMAWMIPAAAAAVLALVALPLGRKAVPEALADEAVSQHLRAFAAGRSCQHESGDAEEVARFLSGKLAREVAVPPPARGRLVGARGCSLFGERTGAVIYQDGAVSVTMFLPAPGSRAARASENMQGHCAPARDGQTICVLPGEDGEPRVMVGELPAPQLASLLASR